jgi:hypothetical protein
VALSPHNNFVLKLSREPPIYEEPWLTGANEYGPSEVPHGCVAQIVIR